MLAKRYKLTDADISDAQRTNFVWLRKLLGEKGYAMFSPAEKWQHYGELDLLVFKKKDSQVTTTPVLVYPGRNDTIVLRSWSGEEQHLVIEEIRRDIPRSHVRNLRLRQARRPLIGDWRDYLSANDIEAARLLDLGV